MSRLWARIDAAAGRARRRLRRNERLRRAYSSFDLFRKYGTFRPDKVRIAGSPHSLYVDTSEPRGCALARGFCGGQPALKAIWLRAIAELSPDLVVDVGANYGEFAFMPTYPPGTVVVVIEPQPSLRPYLIQSRNEHFNRDAIELVFALASDTAGGDVRFFVDDDWSGRSSAMRTHAQQRVREVQVPVTSVDSLASGRVHAETTLLFKIDVEGYEPLVLAGMRSVLDTCGHAVGVVELHGRNLQRLGIVADDYVTALQERFVVYAIGHGGDVRLVPAGRFGALFPDPTFSTDLVLVCSSRLASALGLPP